MIELKFNDQKTTNLGVIMADIDSQDETITATISSDSEVLTLNGVASINPTGDYHFDAELTLNNQLPVVLRTMLAAAGQRQADGRISINVSGTIPRPTQPESE